eukprot:10581669-Karenia_brevis.AAC.1
MELEIVVCPGRKSPGWNDYGQEPSMSLRTVLTRRRWRVETGFEAYYLAYRRRRNNSGGELKVH